MILYATYEGGIFKNMHCGNLIKKIITAPNSN